MPIDPQISLGVTPIAPPANPLGAIGGYADLQDKLNQLTLFRQTFAARQKAGQILASAPDMETGLQGLMKDPLTAPFSGEIINQARQGMLAQVQLQGEQQKQATDGLGAIIKGMSVGVSSPSMVGPSIDATMKTLSQSAQTRDGPAVDSLKSALTDGLPSDPAAARAEFTKRMAALSLAGGVTEDTVRAQSGTMKPQVIQTTDATGAVSSRVVGGPAAGGSADLGQGGAPPTAPAGSNTLAPGLPPGTLSVGPSNTRAAEQKGLGEAGVAVQDEMNTNAEALPTQLARLNTIIDTLGKFQAGGGANWRTEGGKFLQSLKNIGVQGITQDNINGVANSSLPDSQIFNSLIKQFVTRQLSTDVKGQGKAMRDEVTAYLQSADATTDPAALLKILNLAKYSMQVGYDKSQKFQDYKEKGMGDFASFPAYYTKNFGGSILPPSNTGGGLNLSPTPSEAVKGALPAPDTKTYASPKELLKAYNNGDFGSKDSAEAYAKAAGILRKNWPEQFK